MEARVHASTVARRLAVFQPSLRRPRRKGSNKAMLVPKIYQVDDPVEIESFIRQHSFATVVSNLEGAHIPLLYDSKAAKFSGHLTTGNPVLEAMRLSGRALAIFQGPHGYISSSTYVDQTIPPTWNFTAVHAVGRVEILNSAKDKLRILQETVSHYEAANGTSWSFESDDGEIHSMLPMITGFEIQIESLQCCYKLSQNRTSEDFESAVRHLEMKSDESYQTLARWMRTHSGKAK